MSELPVISVAPMMDWTDRHCRYFLRLISPHVRLYTEMVTTGAIIHGDRMRFLSFDPSENLLILQLGGSDPLELAQCAKIAEDWGYDEVNLNVGCPSDRVQNGRFGACLMKEPELVAEGVTAMIERVEIPVTVKTRIGIDKEDSYEFLERFIKLVSEAGCQHFVIHARNAWLQGLSPKQNREVPPLNYEYVYRIKKDYPDLNIVINGGIKDCDAIDEHLKHVDGVMIGREAYHNPYFLAEIEKRFFDSEDSLLSRKDVLARFIEYAQKQLNDGIYLSHLSRHILGLFQGLPGARHWRRYLSEHGPRQGASIDVLEQAGLLVSD